MKETIEKVMSIIVAMAFGFSLGAAIFQQPKEPQKPTIIHWIGTDNNFEFLTSRVPYGKEIYVHLPDNHVQCSDNNFLLTP